MDTVDLNGLPEREARNEVGFEEGMEDARELGSIDGSMLAGRSPLTDNFAASGIGV